MSESTPQLVQFLFPAAAQSGLPGAPGQLRSGGLPGLPASRSESALTPVDTAFQRQLQALLDTSGARADPAAVALPELPATLRATAPPPLSSAPLSAGRAGLTPQLDADPAGDGNTLPEGGNILPPPLIAAAPAVRTEAPVATTASPESAALLRDVVTAPLNDGRAAVAEQLAGRVPAGSELTAGKIAAEQIGDEPELRIARELQTPQPVATREPGTRVVAESAPGQPVAPAVNNPISELRRRANTLDSARDRVSAPGAEARLAELSALSGRADSSVRVLPAVEAATAQFNLHARPEGLLQQGALTPEQALRDLSSLAPLRPQSGDGATNWSSGLGQRLLMMAENGVESARLRLNPASLGALDIHVNVEDDQARVWFGAQNASTRDALEAALPRLRAMFADQGLQLAQADVGERGSERDGPGGDAEAAGGASAVASESAASLPDGGLADSAARLWGDSGRSGLDIYV
ncbi:MAG: hypothetical protein HKN56_08380 [Gammaproteobacteria bacterium]|nr:hypothetical protein [Gammaproteobacteria bacterium]